MFVAFDEAEETVSAQRLHQTLHRANQIKSSEPATHSERMESG